MSLADGDAKYPAESHGIPPSPTRENPGGVFPKSSPAPATPQGNHGTKLNQAPSNSRSVFSNPFALDAALDKIEHALDDFLADISSEETRGVNGEETELTKKFRGWRNELDTIRGISSVVRKSSYADMDAKLGITQEGGMFTD